MARPILGNDEAQPQLARSEYITPGSSYDFEKYKVLQYLNNILEKDGVDRLIFSYINNYSFKTMIDGISQQIFKKDAFDFVNSNNMINVEKMKPYMEDFVKKVKSFSKKEIKKISSVERKLNLLQKELNLSEVEKEILGICVRYTLGTVDDLIQVYFKNDGSCNHLWIQSDYFSKMLNVNKEIIRKNLLPKSKLFDSGILSVDGGRSIMIPGYIRGIFTSEQKLNKKLLGEIIGETADSNLKWEDFNHLKDRELVKNILKNAINKKEKGINILLYGEPGTGKTEFAKVLGKELKVPTYLSPEGDVLNGDTSYRLTQFRFSYNILKNKESGILIFDEAEDVLSYNNFSEKDKHECFINKTLEEVPIATIWTLNSIDEVDPAFVRRMTYVLKFEPLDEKIVQNIWKKEAKRNKNKFLTDEDIQQLSKDYKLPMSAISDSLRCTAMINGNKEDLVSILESKAKALDFSYATKKPKIDFRYDIDFVNTNTNIKKITNSITDSGKLNFSLCLFGASGTGKSEYAKYLADKMNIDFIHIKASDLISCWVGETEKNIARAFHKAKEEKKMLIFDEADSFLQDRSNARNSWEVTQVNEMLTWMESHEYPFICTTNLMDSIDEASLRRFNFKIKFNYLKKEQVENIFNKFFGLKAPENLLNISGLTPGDFSNVYKRVEFLGISDVDEISNMLIEEVKLKKGTKYNEKLGF